MSTKRKQQKRLERQRELLKEFAHQVGDFYEEKQVGEQWYVKMYNRGTDRWQVAIYSNEAYRKYKTFQERV